MWKQFDDGASKIYDINHVRYSSSPAAGFAATLKSNAMKNMDIGLITTMLLLAVQFFACCHLYVSFTSQDRERGTIAALALSPASTTEILLGRAIFHQTLGLTVSALILAIIQPEALLCGQLWLTLIGVGFAWMSVGTIITTLTKTQAQASMMMFSYMLGGSILFYLAGQFPVFRILQLVTFENHAVTLIHTGLTKDAWLFLPGVTLALLASVWAFAASNFFRKQGWQT